MEVQNQINYNQDKTAIEHIGKSFKSQPNLDATFETGLFGSSQLQDMLINVEGMSPTEYKNGGQDLDINYSFAESPFGPLVVASTSKGICNITFEKDEVTALENLKAKFPNARIQRKLDLLQQNALFILQNDWSRFGEIKPPLKSTEYHSKVWENVLKNPTEKLAAIRSKEGTSWIKGINLLLLLEFLLVIIKSLFD